MDVREVHADKLALKFQSVSFGPFSIYTLIPGIVFEHVFWDCTLDKTSVAAAILKVARVWRV